MIKIIVTAFLVLRTILAIAQNPILPIENYIADPSAKVWDDGRLYIYGSRDESRDYWCSYDHYVVSTNNMINWQIVKDALHSKGGLDQIPYSDKPLYAPDCQYFDGKYYMYYCQPDKENAEGVAVSDQPFGPFKNGKAIDIKAYNQIDPAVFVDDDGQAYYLWGQFSLKMAKLNDDRISIDESTLQDSIINESEHFFHEGSYLTKRNGIYYIVYADLSRAGRPTCLGYATSNSVFGPYKYGGVIIDNDHCDPEVWNNHGSIAELNGQWYVFYHRSSHGCRMMRRTCVEPIFFNKDGSIDEVEMTSQGAGKPLNAFEDIEAERACLLYGNVRLQLWSDNNEELTEIHQGDNAAYKYIDFGNGEVRQVKFVVSPGKSPGKILINTGKLWHQKIAEVDVPARIGEEKWIVVTANVKEVSGVQELWLSFQGKTEEMYSIDKFSFSK